MGNEEKVVFPLCLSSKETGVMGSLRGLETGEFEGRQSITVMPKINLVKNRFGKGQS